MTIEKRTTYSDKVALVTGGNSGIGFETAAYLAEQGFAKVIITTRTIEKGENARSLLINRTGRDIFDVLVLEMFEKQKVLDSVSKLKGKVDGLKIDFLVLNAGSSPKSSNIFNSDGVEFTFAVHVIANHVFTIGLLNAGLLSNEARIVIAGSEGARNDVPTMRTADFRKLSNQFNGDLVKTMELIMRNGHQDNVVNQYVTAKTFVVWWTAQLSRRLPKGMVVNTISPGSVPTSNYGRNMPFLARRIIMPMSRLMGFMGMSHHVSKAAERYLFGFNLHNDETGDFYATAKKGRLAGVMAVQNHEHFTNIDFQNAGWEAICKLSKVNYPLDKNLIEV